MPTYFDEAVFVPGSRASSNGENYGYVALYNTHFSLEPLKGENMYRACCRTRKNCKHKALYGKTCQGRKMH